MKQNIPCELIRDLLPLYVDGLTSEASNREIKEHLETCGSCRERYERMKRELEGEGIAALAEETREIDYLKKVRRRGLRKMLLTAAGILAAVALAIFVKLFVIGFPVDSYLITYMDVYEDTVRVGGVFYGSAQCYSRYRLAEQKDGTQKLVIYGTLPSPWNRDGAFNLEAELPEPGGALEIGGARILSDGTVISKLTGRKIPISETPRRTDGWLGRWASGPDWAAIKISCRRQRSLTGGRFTLRTACPTPLCLRSRWSVMPACCWRLRAIWGK